MKRMKQNFSEDRKCVVSLSLSLVELAIHFLPMTDRHTSAEDKVCTVLVQNVDE